MYVELSLHPWKEANFIMENDPLYTFLKLVCKFVLRNFASMFIVLEFSFFLLNLIDFDIVIIFAS